VNASQDAFVLSNSIVSGGHGAKGAPGAVGKTIECGANGGAGGKQGSSRTGRDGIAAQVHAMGARRQRHVGAIVHDDTGACSLDALHAPAHQRPEIARVEIPLPNVNHIDAHTRGRRHEIDESIDRITAAGQAPAIGDETYHDCSIVSIVSMRRRAISSEASSLNPMSRFTTPRPDTPPRT